MRAGVAHAAAAPTGQSSAGGRGDARAEADLLDQPANVHSPPVAQQPAKVVGQAAEAEALGSAGCRPEEGSGQRKLRAPGKPDHSRQPDSARARHVHRTPDRTADRGHQRSKRVLAVDDLEAGIEAQIGGAGREREVAGELAVQRGPDRRLVAQYRAGQVRMAAGVGLEVVLDLGHVPLKARA